ncbi:VOC family protein [Comamonadaceae bacterium G21597-S1]|nr:VOC family protein [Comamonadaceae bacterium G21597-S1]
MINTTPTPSVRLPDAQLTHVGVYVRDLSAMVAFYRRTMGMLLNDFGEMNGRTLAFLSRSDNEHHQLVLAHDPQRQFGSESSLNQVSFRVESLAALRDFYLALHPLNLAGMEGRHHGNSWSFYFFDPEGNKIEIYAVTQWQVQQPWRRPMDLTQPLDVLEQETAAYLKEVAHRPLAEWQAEVRERLAEANGHEEAA